MSGALDSWVAFNTAMAGASAALAGLVIVAASVNIHKFIDSGSLTARLASSIATLMLTLVASAVALMPDVDLRWYGVVVAASALVAGIFQVHAAQVIMRGTVPGKPQRVAKSTLGFLPIVAYLAAGLALVANQDAGLPLTAVGSLLAVIVAISVSWIALVEVLR